MNISLPSELEKFVRHKIDSGEFTSPEEVVAAGLARLMEDELDDDTLAAIEESEAQLDRGEEIPLDDAFDQLRKKYSAR